jgi:hypothetical protein
MGPDQARPAGRRCRAPCATRAGCAAGRAYGLPGAAGLRDGRVEFSKYVFGIQEALRLALALALAFGGFQPIIQNELSNKLLPKRRLTRISHREQVHRGSESAKVLLRQSLSAERRSFPDADRV